MRRTERVGHTDNWWEEVDKYYRGRRKMLRLDDINECIENERKIQRAVGRLVETDLHISWHEERYYYKSELDARLREIPYSWKAIVIPERERLYNCIEHCYFIHTKYYTLLFRPTEIRDIDRSETWRYPDGRLKPIITNWEKIKNYAIRFINESI